MDDSVLHFISENYKELMEFAINTSWSGILIANNKGQYVYANDKYEEITGFSRAMIYQLSSTDLMEKIIREKLSVVNLVLEKKKEIIIEQSKLNNDRAFLVKGVPYFGKNGDIEYVVCHLSDTTDLRRYQEELKIAKFEKNSLSKELVKCGARGKDADNEIIYKSKAVAYVMEQINLVAKTDTTVFFQGESGTGKELFSKRLHNESDRNDKRFIKINCSAIPETLLESELFGYESGTFTGGNSKGKIGLLEYANGGTMLLDEIGDMSLNLQSKLLRVLQEKEFTRLGGHDCVKVDVRFIAATNADILKMVKEKRFREDLYYRLNIIPIRIPSLSERREDIPILIYFFLRQFNAKYMLNKTISYDVVESMFNKSFPGNVRQLQNILERLMLLTPGSELTKKDFDRLYYNETENPVYDLSFDFGKKSFTSLIDTYEKYILAEYKKKYGSSYKMAEQLQMNQSTIFRKLKKHHIQ